VGMLLLFYCFQGLHWWANFELGISDSETSTVYNLIIFGSAVLVIITMVALGNPVNKKKITHEFYTEKIFEEKQKQAEKDQKNAAKAQKDAEKQGAAMIGKTGM